MGIHRNTERAIRVAVYLAAALVPSIAAAEGEPCNRDTECVALELCVTSVCTIVDPPPPACASDDDCAQSGVSCTEDGACKHEGVVCTSASGSCWIDDGSGRCDCVNGEGSAYSNPYNPDDPPEVPTDAELLASCGEDLLETCGAAPPAMTGPQGSEGSEADGNGDDGEGSPESDMIAKRGCGLARPGSPWLALAGFGALAWFRRRRA